MPVPVIRYRLYQCGRYYVEVWDTLENQWEEFCRLPEGELLLVLEDPEIDSMKRYRKRALKQHNICDDGFATWNCAPVVWNFISYKFLELFDIAEWAVGFDRFDKLTTSKLTTSVSHEFPFSKNFSSKLKILFRANQY